MRTNTQGVLDTWYLYTQKTQKANFPKESVENANLYKPVLNKKMNNVRNTIS